jgi:methyl-accepting chemotaxis protein
MRIKHMLYGAVGALTGLLLLENGLRAADAARSARDAARFGQFDAASAQLEKGIIELSFERSVSQVALALPDPIPSAFADLLAQQRRKADERFAAVAAALDALDDDLAAAELAAGLARERAALAELRSGADAALGQPAAGRPHDAAQAVPDALKDLVLRLRALPDALIVDGVERSATNHRLSMVQSLAWEVREFGGRERTLLAIAVLTGAPLPDAVRAEAAQHALRAADAGRRIASLVAGDAAIPAALRDAAAALERTYFGDYAALRGAVLLASTGATPAYPLPFDAFFERSSAALETAVAVSYAAGDARLAYWQQRRTQALVDGALALAALLGVLALAGWVLAMVHRRILLRIEAVRLAMGDYAAGRVPRAPGARHADEIGDMSDAFSALVATQERAVGEVAQVAGAIARGDFSRRIEDPIPGRLGEVREAINASVDSVRDTMEALQDVMRAMAAGRFDARMRASVPEESRRGIDGAMQGLDDAFARMDAALAAWTEGRFEARLGSGLPGRLGALAGRFDGTGEALMRGFSEVRRIAAAVAGGDLSVVAEGEHPGELGRAVGDLDAAVRRLFALMTEWARVTRALDETAKAVRDQGVELQRHSASAIDGMLAHIRESVESIRDTERVVHAVAERTAGARVVGDEGRAAVARAVAAMGGLRESTARIQEVTRTIDEFAFQTNLLALNAAVEAARAGEQGRGFAVVAGEVRGLAKRSAESVAQIRGLVDDGAHRARDGVAQVEASDAQLGRLLDAVADIDAAARRVREGTARQLQSASALESEVDAQGRRGEQGRALAERLGATAAELTAHSDALRSAMAQFRLDPHPAGRRHPTNNPQIPGGYERRGQRRASDRTGTG